MSGFIRRASLNQKSLVYHGFVSEEEKRSIVWRCRLVIVPSIWNEAFGSVVTESLVMGKPVVGFELGGVGETVHNSGGGLVVKPYNVREFASAVREIASNNSLSKELGNLGRKYVLENTNSGDYGRFLAKVYLSVLRGSGATAL